MLLDFRVTLAISVSYEVNTNSSVNSTFICSKEPAPLHQLSLLYCKSTVGFLCSFIHPAGSYRVFPCAGPCGYSSPALRWTDCHVISQTPKAAAEESFWKRVSLIGTETCSPWVVSHCPRSALTPSVGRASPSLNRYQVRVRGR